MQSVATRFNALWRDVVKSGEGLQAPAIGALLHFEETPGCKISAAAEAIGQTTAAITTLVDRLEKRNLVYRQHSATDRRIVEVHLTEKGQALADKIINTLNGNAEVAA